MNVLQNSVHLIGHVGTNPEFFTLPSGERKVRFRMATHHVYVNKKGEKSEETDWHSIEVYGKLVDIVEKFVPKGKQIGIEGRLTTQTYDSKDGSKRSFTKVICKELLLLGGGPGSKN